ncbi:MAG: hypothetical protein EYC71_11370 [Gammaproteobacteria bacterium]|nr:MAG: hypothetical protein EYC71_11370 [Gammaproteobacteria bacterium]
MNDGVSGQGGPGAAGVRGRSISQDGFGVVGYASAITGTGRGVYGQADAPGSIGVHGYSGPGIGVMGVAGATGYAGVFNGRVSVNGTLSKAARQF